MTYDPGTGDIDGYGCVRSAGLGGTCLATVHTCEWDRCYQVRVTGADGTGEGDLRSCVAPAIAGVAVEGRAGAVEVAEKV